MKVLHLINNLGSGGAEKLLEILVPIMNKLENIEVEILILTDQENVFYNSLISEGVKINVIKYRSVYDFRNVFEIRKYISNGKYSIVHAHTFPTQYWVALSRLILRNNKTKFITTEHSTHNRRREKFYFRFLDKIVYSQYDSIISITEKAMDNLIDWISPKPKEMHKYIVIENGIDIENITESLPYKKNDLINSIKEKNKLVCMVGRFTEAKDQPTLIKSMSNLPEDIHLVLVGEGPLMDNNKKLVKELKIAHRVHFLGFRQDVLRILKTADIIVLSSHWEGLSLASIEGLASGKPFIASSVPGLEEVVGEYGMLFEEENDTELSRLIQQLIQNKDFYNKVARSSLEGSKKYEIKHTITELLKVYRKK